MPTDRPPTTGWTPSTFERERTTYEARKAELLRDEGTFVVIRGDVVLGPYETYEQAITAGHEQFGLGPFYTKEIREVEPIVMISRDISPIQS